MMADVEATMDRLEAEMDAVIDQLAATTTLASRHALETQLEAVEVQLLAVEHEWNRLRRETEAAEAAADVDTTSGRMGATSYLLEKGLL